MRFSLHMVFNMLFQVRFSNWCIVTMVTFVCSLFSVYHQMLLQRTLNWECIVTNITFIAHLVFVSFIKIVNHWSEERILLPGSLLKSIIKRNSTNGKEWKWTHLDLILKWKKMNLYWVQPCLVFGEFNEKFQKFIKSDKQHDHKHPQNLKTFKFILTPPPDPDVPVHYRLRLIESVH